jgi:hypothetical protein
MHFAILNIKVNEGELYYHEKLTPIDYSIIKISFESPGMRWNIDTVAGKFSSLSGTGKGEMQVDFSINLKSLDYRISTIVNKFDLQILGQYLKDLSNYGKFAANLDAHLKAAGNLGDEENITASGSIAINDFHLGKNSKDDYVFFDRFGFLIDELAPKDHKYLIDSLSLNRLYFKYERYVHLDNLQSMFGEKGSKIAAANSNNLKFNLLLEIGKYIRTLSKIFLRSNYKVNHFEINRADLKFNDYSLSEEFSMAMKPFNIIADSIGKNRKRANIFLKSGLEPYGSLSIDLSIDPNDSSDFDMRYNFLKLSAAMFNPYTVTYTSFPLDRGIIELNGAWKVRNGIIQSNNHLLIIDPRATKRVRKKDTKWVPMPLILSFIRERGNVIDYEIPITGNLKNPKFHFHDVLSHLFENIFVKPATTGYRTQVKNIETEIEKSLTVKWQFMKSSLLPSQEKFVGEVAKFLTKTTDAYITVSPELYETKEKEQILLFEAKKKYFMASHNKNASSFSVEDSTAVDKLSIKDSSFVHYLNRQIKNPMIFTVQDKCARLIDASITSERFRQLSIERAITFMAYFKNHGVDKQVKMNSVKNIVPFNGFSFYQISYKGEFPEPLIKAYIELNELNEEAPRKKFEKERKENKTALR